MSFMKSAFFKLGTLSVLLLFTGCGRIFDYLGGNFKGAPSEMEEGLSPLAKKLIDSAFENLNPDEIVDHHVHATGMGKGTPCSAESDYVYLNPARWNLASPIWKFRSRILMSAMGVKNLDRANVEFANRLLDLVRHFRGKGKFYLLAMDAYHEDDGSINLDKTDAMIPSGYAFDLSNCLNKKLGAKRFVPVISVHPYRSDALEELERFAGKGVRYVKWLPNAMNIDPTAERNIPYYKKMAELDMTLITHTGHEYAIHSEPQNQKFGSPLAFKAVLDAGVTVIMSHSGRDGTGPDSHGNLVSNFDLFMEMMNRPEYKGRLYGDISALTILGKNNLDFLTAIIGDKSLRGRMLNGSDYPIPAVNFLKITGRIAWKGMITYEEKKALDEIYGYNPLLFDFVLKRTIRHPDDKNLRLPESVFLSLEANRE